MEENRTQKIHKIIFISGGILLSIILGFGGLIGDFGFQGMHYDVSSKAYLQATLPPIISTWSESALRKCASPQLLKELNANPGKLTQEFHRLAALGPFEGFRAIEGQSNVSLETLRGKTIKAHYVADAIFLRGTARIKVRLVQLPFGWKIEAFNVSPRFLHLKKG